MQILRLFQKIFGTYSERQIKRIRPLADAIEALAEKYHTELLFFVLFADYDNYDKNISHNNLHFQPFVVYWNPILRQGEFS